MAFLDVMSELIHCDKGLVSLWELNPSILLLIIGGKKTSEDISIKLKAAKLLYEWLVKDQA
jgi:hypothetical protein